MTFEEAQADMRAGYMSGAPGVLASSLAWWAAAAAAWFVSADQAVWVLFIGGMLIFPVGLVIAKLLKARGNHTKGNPLAELAGANTFWLILSLPLAYAISLFRLDWLFPAMLLMIGGRYLTFGLLYGMRFYWGIGLALAGLGFAAVVIGAAPVVTASAGAAIELVGAIIAFSLHAKLSSRAGAAA